MNRNTENLEKPKTLQIWLYFNVIHWQSGYLFISEILDYFFNFHKKFNQQSFDNFEIDLNLFFVRNYIVIIKCPA